jgi:nitrous oxide reductase
MAWQIIVDLFSSIQSIKRKYPMVVLYQRHLQKIGSDETLQDAEIDHFKKWMLKNPDVLSKTLKEPYYSGSKLSATIYFGNVLELGSEGTIDAFWKRLAELETVLFPEGRPAVPQKSETTVGADDAAAAMAILEDNPIFADVIDTVKSTVANINPDDIGSIMETKDFNKLIGTIRSGIKSGKYKISDLCGTVNSVIACVQDKLDPETKDVLSSATTMMAAAERGEQPDVQKLMGMIKKMNLK